MNLASHDHSNAISKYSNLQVLHMTIQPEYCHTVCAHDVCIIAVIALQKHLVQYKTVHAVQIQAFLQASNTSKHRLNDDLTNGADTKTPAIIADHDTPINQATGYPTLAQPKSHLTADSAKSKPSKMLLQAKYLQQLCMLKADDSSLLARH